MTGKRTYGQACGVAHAMDLLGERWAVLIVRDLLLGPKRFSDVQAGLPAAGPNVLTQRLRDLEAAGVVRRRTLPPPAGSRVYELTEWGAELEPVISRLGLWGSRSPVVPVSGEYPPDSLMLSLRYSFEAEPDPEWNTVYDIRLGREQFTATVAAGRLEQVVRDHPRTGPDTVIETDPLTLSEVMSGRRDAREAVDDTRITLEGDTEAGFRLLAAARM